MERARDFLHYRAANLAMHPLDVRRTHERALIAAQQERRHFYLLDVRAHHPSAVLAPCARLRIEAKGPRASRQLLGAEQRESLDIEARQVGLRRLQSKFLDDVAGGAELGADAAVGLPAPSPHQAAKQRRWSVRRVDDDQGLE